MRPVVFGRTGWLERYDSERKDEGAPLFGGSFNDDNVGSEIDNFRPIGRYVYGYIQTPGRDLGFNRDRVSAMDGVLVVLCAKHPEGGQVVVGWYKNARLFEEAASKHPRYGFYNFRSRKDDVVLLNVCERSWAIPKKQKGAMGQANVFYVLTADGKRRKAKWITTILKNIDAYKRGTPERRQHPSSRSGQGIGLTTTERDAVEEYAMRTAERHYRKRRYTVEVRGRPFDLLCRRGREELRVEVKGTTSAGEKVIVTMGEVRSARAHRTDLFVLSEIELSAGVPRGGRKDIISPWRPKDEELSPTEFRYTLPS